MTSDLIILLRGLVMAGSINPAPFQNLGIIRKDCDMEPLSSCEIVKLSS
jgi:hypothetical protein